VPTNAARMSLSNSSRGGWRAGGASPRGGRSALPRFFRELEAARGTGRPVCRTERRPPGRGPSGRQFVEPGVDLGGEAELPALHHVTAPGQATRAVERGVAEEIDPRSAGSRARMRRAPAVEGDPQRAPGFPVPAGTIARQGSPGAPSPGPPRTIRRPGRSQSATGVHGRIASHRDRPGGEGPSRESRQRSDLHPPWPPSARARGARTRSG